jgi:hypothetical protein
MQSATTGGSCWLVPRNLSETRDGPPDTAEGGYHNSFWVKKSWGLVPTEALAEHWSPRSHQSLDGGVWVFPLGVIEAVGQQVHPDQHLPLGTP